MLEEMMETAVPPVEVTVGESFGIGYGGIHAEGVEDEAVMVELAAAVEQHLVAVSPNAPGACIDGRGCDQHVRRRYRRRPRRRNAGGARRCQPAGRSRARAR